MAFDELGTWRNSQWPAGLTLMIPLVLWMIISGTRKRLEKESKHDDPKCAQAWGKVAVQPLADFDWKLEEPRQLRPFKPVYHITMALRPDTLSDWIIIDKNYHDRVRLRARLLAQQDATVHGCLPPGRDAVREVYTFLLGVFLPGRYPAMFRLSADGTVFQNLVTGASHPVEPPRDAGEALRVIGTTVEEDMFILSQTPEGHVSDAFVCCFPSGFDPSEKLGKLLRDIHGPVPSYDKIGPSMERFFARLEVGRSVKRSNWSLQTHDQLFDCKKHDSPDDGAHKEEKVDISKVTPPSIATVRASGGNLADDMQTPKTHLRVELQTLTRLPQTGSILFSFKTYMYPLTKIKAEGLGEELADAIEGLKKGNAPGMWIYKGSTRWAEQVCEYLKA